MAWSNPTIPMAALQARRVLLIRPSALGDVSRTVPALVTLRRALPQAHIDWLVQDALADAIRHHPALDGVITFPRRRFAQMWRSPQIAREAWTWARDLGRQQYDLAIDLQGLFRSGLFTRLTGAAHRVGFANAHEGAWLGYNRKHWIDLSGHAVDRMLGLLEAEGFTPVRDMRLYVGEADNAWLDQLLAPHGGPDTPYATLAPVTRWRSKMWPLENVLTVARRLLDTRLGGRKLIVLASPSEQEAIQPLRDALGDHPDVLFPSTTVGGMMALLSRTRLLVCNDSGPLHIAVGFDRPTVAVFGPTDPSLVGPYGRMDAVVCPPGLQAVGRRAYRQRADDQSLIAQVSVEKVWSRIEQQLVSRQRQAV